MTMRPVYYDFAPAAEDTNGFANDVTAASGQPFTLAATVSGDDLAHKVVITPSGSVTGNYTISGLDADGQTQSETLATDTVNAVTSVNYYSSLTSVLAPSGLGAGTVDIGWADEFCSQTIPVEVFVKEGPPNCQVTLTGTANFDIEDTLSDIRASYSPPPGQNDYTWLNDANFTAKSASLAVALAVIARAIRLVVNSYTTGATLQLAIVTPR